MKRITPLALLLAACIGGYFALVTSQEFVGCGTTCEMHSRAPLYRIDSRTTRAAFAPALWLDQHLRPAHWNWTVDLELDLTGGTWEHVPANALTDERSAGATPARGDE